MYNVILKGDKQPVNLQSSWQMHSQDSYHKVVVTVEQKRNVKMKAGS